MSWSLYREYEGGYTASPLGVAFSKYRGDSHSGNQSTVHTKENSDIQDALETPGLKPNNNIAARIESLWNEGHIGAAVGLLTHALYEKKNVNIEILDISDEMLAYFETHLPHEQILISNIESARQSFHDYLTSFDFNGLHDALTRYRDSLVNEGDPQEALQTLKVSLDDNSSVKELIDSMFTDLDSGADFQSEAQITAKLAAIKSLEQWAKEQEMHMEQIKPKQPDWYEEQQNKKKLPLPLNTQDLRFKPRWAA